MVPARKTHKGKWSLELFSLKKKKIKEKTCFKRGEIDVHGFLHLVWGQSGGFRRNGPLLALLNVAEHSYICKP